MLCFKNFVFSQPQVEELCGLQTMDLEDVVNYGPQADLFSNSPSSDMIFTYLSQWA